MYKLVLILKYLRRKLAPMFAALAVTLCTAMVIIVISVMGGFLDLMRTSARKLTGDVIVHGDITGFRHYQEMIDAIEALPEADAATALISNFGLVNVNGHVVGAEVVGIDPEKFDNVVQYRETLYWTSAHFLDMFRNDAFFSGQPPENQPAIEADIRTYEQNEFRDFGMAFKPLPHGEQLPGCVMGIEVAPTNLRNKQGKYKLAESRTLGHQVTVTVVPLSAKGTLGAYEPARGSFVIVNESKSGLYDIDKSRAYVPFDLLQKMLKMERIESPHFDPQTGETLPGTKVTPARATDIMVRSAPGVPLSQVRDAVQRATDAVVNDHGGDRFPFVMTWEDRHGVLLSAVQNEKGLITFLFAIISVVAFVMVATTFYNIVLEKTHDIGVLRAIGGSRTGIASIFLGYGLAIGVIGAVLGFGMAWVIVFNLNEINLFLCNKFDVCMWKPQTYYFDEVPEQINAIEVIWIMIGAVVSSVGGSMIPAVVAAMTDPAQSLRHE